MRLTIICICLGLIAFACDDNSTSSRNGYFRVRVIDSNNQPVEGTVLEGGFDLEGFNVVTGPDGYALIPDYGLNVYTTFFKDNYYSSYTSWLQPAEYVINQCPFQMSEIGDIDGTAIKFDGDRIATVSYQAIYHLYQYSDAGVSELYSVQLPIPFKDFALYGDTLLYTTHDDGVYIYLISDLQNPRQLYHLEILGILWPMARKDTLLAIGDLYNIGPLRIFDVNLDGTVELLDEIRSFHVEKMAFIGNYLVTLGNSDGIPNIFDINSPRDISLIYSGAIENFTSGFFSGDSIILKSNNSHDQGYSYHHAVLTLDNPENPSLTSRFDVPGRLISIVDDTLAVGNYYTSENSITVFHRNQNAYDALTMVSRRYGINEYFGANPPYFLFNGKLYKLTPFE